MKILKATLMTTRGTLSVAVLVFMAIIACLATEAMAQPINASQPGIYLGRPIAWTMTASGADWLTRKDREKEESTREMIRALRLKPGMVVADVGCGNGYHALKMAPLVGAEGRVLCVDIQQEMLDLLIERAAQRKITNYETIVGSSTSPKLPAKKVDLILLVDAYHEFTDPVSMLRSMRQSLASGGVLALVEFRTEDPAVPMKPDHKMSKA
ncbi:MAG: SAM-dependent methyltransferase, partial [Candidatus Krumholzibacteriia bacterium]